jgi:hypothetical protein
MLDAVISFNGESLAGRSGLAGHELELWSLKTGQLVHRLAPPKDSEVWALGFAAGDRLVGYQTADSRPTYPVWDLKTGALLFTIVTEPLKGNQIPELLQVAVSPGGHFVASIDNDKLRIFSTADGSNAADVPLPPARVEDPFGNGHEVKGIAFSPDGGELTAVCDIEHSGKYHIVSWDMATGRVTADYLVPQIKDERGFFHQEVKLEILPDGKGWRFGRQILDRATGETVYRIPLAKDREGAAREGVAIKMLDADHMLVVGTPTMGGGLRIGTATLPRAELRKTSK